MDPTFNVYIYIYRSNPYTQNDLERVVPALKLNWGYTPKTNGWIPKLLFRKGWKRWVLLNMAIFGIYVRFLGDIFYRGCIDHLLFLVHGHHPYHSTRCVNQTSQTKNIRDTAESALPPRPSACVQETPDDGRVNGHPTRWKGADRKDIPEIQRPWTCWLETTIPKSKFIFPKNKAFKKYSEWIGLPHRYVWKKFTLLRWEP